VNETGPADLLPGSPRLSPHVGHLEPARKMMLADAAVIGRVFWAEAIAALSGREAGEVLQACKNCRGRNSCGRSAVEHVWAA